MPPNPKSFKPSFEVTISGKASLTALKKMIIDESPYHHHVPPVKASQLNLWKPRDTILDAERGRKLAAARHDLSTIADEVTLGADIALLATRKGKASDAINLIIEFIPRSNPTTIEEQEEALDTLGALNKRFTHLIDHALKRDAPSASAELTSYREVQGGSCPIYDGRYHPTQGSSTVAPPIHLYNPVFAHFLDDAANPALEVPDRVVVATAKLMRKASAVYDNEYTRRDGVRDSLKKAVYHELVAGVVDDYILPDDAVGWTVLSADGSRVPLLMEQEEGELGSNGCDPSTQASFTMLKYWAQSNAKRNNSKRLTDFMWLGNGAVLTDNTQCFRVARILHSLTRSLAHLRKYYATLTSSTNPPSSRFFPFPTSFHPNHGLKISFEYLQALERGSACVIFKCRTKEELPRILVVKFAQTYGSAAHELLAREGLAPQLLYCGPVDPSPDAPSYQNLKMIVMEYIDGETVAAMEGGFPDGFEAQLTRIVSLLHDNGYVYGDLRQPNVMVAGDERVKLIDFDWAGKEGEATYPINLAKNMWPNGAQAMGLITQDHDRAMLKSMVDYCNTRHI
ncbi:hypothetical protein R3P38DRAFT_3270575 [Favolaschia claudopus]|uniref:Protein kinase domain-containing protein n=1 Tax=Favolaschia claudopus TaxID=2862362 RepID=A0AAW0B9P7_9AGAR